MYLKTSIVLTSRFNLDNSGEWYELFYQDMEIPKCLIILAWGAARNTRSGQI